MTTPYLLKFSANLSILFQELELEARFAAAADLGFQAIELWYPYELSTARVAELLKQHSLQCVGLNTPAGDAANGDWGLAVDPNRRKDFQNSVVLALEYADAMQCRHVHVMAGQVQTNLSKDDAWACYIENIAYAARAAAAVDKVVMIEPLNAVDRPTYLLNTQAQAREVIERLALPNVKIMLDLFHLQRGEGNLIENMLRSLPHAAHVQIADNPGRHEPGTGEVNFDAVFKALVDAGYEGWVGCEYSPSGSTQSSLAWSVPWNQRQTLISGGE
jgi:hydroxypyruvate isomerase